MNTDSLVLLSSKVEHLGPVSLLSVSLKKEKVESILYIYRFINRNTFALIFCSIVSLNLPLFINMDTGVLSTESLS